MDPIHDLPVEEVPEEVQVEVPEEVQGVVEVPDGDVPDGDVPDGDVPDGDAQYDAPANAGAGAGAGAGVARAERDCSMCITEWRKKPNEFLCYSDTIRNNDNDMFSGYLCNGCEAEQDERWRWEQEEAEQERLQQCQYMCERCGDRPVEREGEMCGQYCEYKYGRARGMYPRGMDDMYSDRYDRDYDDWGDRDY